jgi:flavin-dependent dehydrogenase
VASGARLLQRTRYDEPALTDGRVTGATLIGPDGRLAVRARWVVGADGARSRVARSLGVERPVLAPRRLGLVARYAGTAALRDHGEMHVGAGRYIGLAPTPGGQLNVGVALPLDGAGTAEARFAAAIGSLPAVAARLDGLRRLTGIRGAAPIGHRVASAAGPGWLLVGDAAGFIDPFTGEGIYRALRSARLAADALQGSGDAAGTYRAARRAAFSAKNALTWLVQGMLASPPLLDYALRRLETRPELAATLGAALGDCRPASTALAPRFLASVLRP